MQDETRVAVDVPYLGGVVTMHFATVEGWVDFDRTAPEAARADIAVAAADVRTGMRLVDALVRSPAWLNAEAHPAIGFRLERLERTSPSTAEVRGQATLWGVTRPVTLYAEVFRYEEGDAGRFEAGFDLTGEVDRRAFGHTRGIPHVAAVLPVRIRLLLREE